MSRPAAAEGRPVPLLDLAAEYQALKGELDQAALGVLASGQYVLGPEVAAFEKEFAATIGSRHGVGLNSGTDALTIGLRAAGIRPGDRVLVPAFTFFATAESVVHAGATPVFADVEEDTLTLDPDDAQRRAREAGGVQAVVPVHLFGLGADLDALGDLAADHGWTVVEDVAQATGGRWRDRMLGSLGRLGAFSFFPSKNLGACGDGGFVATSDDRVAHDCRRLRAHGALDKYRNEDYGYNSRLDALQAALLRVKLRHLERHNQARRAVAACYDAALRGSGCRLPPDRPHNPHVYHQYTIQADGRDALQARLQAAGVATAVYYPVPTHRLPVFGDRQPRMPVAERAAQRVLSLPMGPYLSPGDQDRVIRQVVAVVEG